MTSTTDTPIKADFDRTDPEAIFDYSENIIGKSLHSIVGKAAMERLRKRKGGLGQMVEELFFGYGVNSDRSADFSEASLELKCTPLLRSGKDGSFRIKERLVCTMIDYFELVATDFKDSHLLRKCGLMLLLFYLHKKDVPLYDYEFLFRVLWQLPEKDLMIIESDYETIRTKVKEGNAHLLSEGDTLYLGACRKGQKGDNPQDQPYSAVKAKKRAFSLKPSYMRYVLSHVTGQKNRSYSNFSRRKNEKLQLVSEDELRKASFEQVITQRFSRFLGMDYIEICDSLEEDAYQSKSKHADIAGLIASDKASKRITSAEEFLKSGIILKTVRISGNGMPKESMSFKNIDYQEIYENDEWEDSELYELFTRRFLFVVFKETDREIEIRNRKTGQTTNENAYVLDKVFFWTMPPRDLDRAKDFWRHIKEQVVNDRISLDSFWNISDDKDFHIRQKGKKGNYKNCAVNPNGGMADKLCYWFNAKYVKSVIEAYSKG